MSFPSIDLATELALIDPAPWDDSELAPLTPHELAVLASIKQGESSRPARRPSPASGRPWKRFALPAFATAAAATAIAVVLPLLAPTAATAFTPPPLAYSPIEQSVSEVIADARAELLARTDGVSSRTVETVGWYVELEPEESDDVVIMPQRIERTWNEDLSGRQIITAGKPYWADPNSTAPISADVPVEGTVISEMEFGPGEFFAPIVEPPSDQPDELRAVLSRLGMAHDGEDAASLIDGVESLMSLWSLGDAQHAALLSLLGESDGLKVLGETIDREGRDAIALGAESLDYAGTSRTLLISAETGRIIGIERARITPLPPLAAGDVLSYTLWKDGS